MLWSRNTGKYRPLFSYYLDNSKNRLNQTYVVYVSYDFDKFQNYRESHGNGSSVLRN